jgi:uncharacterized protein (TIGR03437 family)
LTAGPTNTNISVTGLTNAASVTTANACSPGSWLNIAGAGFTTEAPQSGNLGTTLNGIQVTVNGVPAPLLYVSSSLITFQCPSLPVGTSIQVAVTTAAGNTNVPIQGVMLAATPGIFVLDAARPGQGVVLVGNTSNLAMPVTDGFPSGPAAKGQYVSILATGLGDVLGGSPAVAVNYVRVWIGGIAVQPSFAGLAPQGGGVFQVIAQIPTNVVSGPSVPLYIEVDLNNGRVVPSNQVVIAVN